MNLEPCKVQDIFKQFIEENIGEGKIWLQSKPQFTANNYFIHDVLLYWLGERGYEYMGMIARNKLIKYIENKYSQK